LADGSNAHIIDSLEVSMHQAARLQFERSVQEFVRWRAVPEPERSPAPAWWWGPAFEVRGMQQPMAAEWCSSLELPVGSSFAAGAQVFLNSLAGQTSLPWPDGFPGKATDSDPAS
jgi:hypothetical protein